MKKLFLNILLIFIPIFSQAEQIPIPELNSPVTDLTGTLSEDEINLLEQKLLGFESERTAQIVVIIIATTGEETIEEFSMRVAKHLGIGFEGEDNGVIILVAKEDRTIRIEIGYGIEQLITDSEAYNVINNEITPKFKSGDFYSGINSGIDQLIFLINSEPDISEIYELEETYQEDIDKDMSSTQFGVFMTVFIFLLIINLFVFFFSQSKLWKLIGFIIIMLSIDLLMGIIAKDMLFTWVLMIYTGALSLFPLIFNIFNLSLRTSSGSSYSSFNTYSSKSSSSNWSSSSSSSWGSSSGSSYSGRGGSFGGGGASGSW